MAVVFIFIFQDTVGDKALRVVDGAIFVAKSAPLGTAVKVSCDYGIETKESLTFVFRRDHRWTWPELLSRAPERACRKSESWFG